MGELKLTEFGAASAKKEDPKDALMSKEDKRCAELAARAQRGDYDDGMVPRWLVGAVANSWQS